MHAPSHAPSPRITALAWGRVEVAGAPRPFRDVMLYPGGARPWDWRTTGTRHRPGIQQADVDELLAHGAEAVVLSRGMLGLLGAPAALLDGLRARGVEVHHLRTPAAVARYNALAASRPVAALIHSTC